MEGQIKRSQTKADFSFPPSGPEILQFFSLSVLEALSVTMGCHAIDLVTSVICWIQTAKSSWPCDNDGVEKLKYTWKCVYWAYKKRFGTTFRLGWHLWSRYLLAVVCHRFAEQNLSWLTLSLDLHTRQQQQQLMFALQCPVSLRLHLLSSNLTFAFFSTDAAPYAQLHFKWFAYSFQTLCIDLPHDSIWNSTRWKKEGFHNFLR